MSKLFFGKEEKLNIENNVLREDNLHLLSPSTYLISAISPETLMGNLVAMQVGRWRYYVPTTRFCQVELLALIKVANTNRPNSGPRLRQDCQRHHSNKRGRHSCDPKIVIPHLAVALQPGPRLTDRRIPSIINWTLANSAQS